MLPLASAVVLFGLLAVNAVSKVASSRL